MSPSISPMVDGAKGIFSASCARDSPASLLSNGGNCVELADLGAVVGVRDSKDPGGGHLDVSRGALRALLADLKRR